MSIELKGRGYVYMHEPSWDACQKIACEFGWMPGYEGVDVPEHNARALARALYQAIRAIEEDRLSEPLVQVVKEASVGHLRAVADLAYAGPFYID